MRDECRGNRKTWRWKHSGVSVKTFSAHIVVVFRLVVSGKRFSTHGRVWGNRKIGEKRQKNIRGNRGNEGNQRDRGRRENREIRKKTEVTDESEGAAELQGPRLGVIVRCPLY